MKTAMIGQDVPTLLPALFADLLFAGREADAEIAIEEGNPAMQEVLQGYGEQMIRKAGQGGTLLVSADRAEVLAGADCVIYAGDWQAAGTAPRRAADKSRARREVPSHSPAARPARDIMQQYTASRGEGPRLVNTLGDYHEEICNGA